MGCVTSRESQEVPGPAPPAAPEARVLKAQAMHLQGHSEQALTELDAVIVADGSCWRAYMERGHVHSALSDWEAAVDDFTRALSMQASSIPALHMRARAYVQLKRHRQALQDVNKACALDPDNSQLRALRHSVLKAVQTDQLSLKPIVTGSTSPTASPTLPGTVPGKLEEEEDAFACVDTPQAQKLCMICMEGQRGCRLRPCMHGALCVPCAEGLKKRGYGCPICGAKVETVEVGQFMSTFATEDVPIIACAAAGVSPSPHTSGTPAQPSRLSRMAGPTPPSAIHTSVGRSPTTNLHTTADFSIAAHTDTAPPHSRPADIPRAHSNSLTQPSRDNPADASDVSPPQASSPGPTPDGSGSSTEHIQGPDLTAAPQAAHTLLPSDVSLPGQLVHSEDPALPDTPDDSTLQTLGADEQFLDSSLAPLGPATAAAQLSHDEA